MHSEANSETVTVLPPLLERITVGARFALQTSFLRHKLIGVRHRQLRDSDVFLASYPKSGNTWLRHLLTSLVNGESTPWKGGLERVSNLVGRHSHLPAIASGGGRLIKTHEPYRNEYRRAILLVRDGRDVAVSEYFHQRAYSKYFYIYGDSFDVFLDRFLVGTVNGYRSWHKHVTSWLEASQSRENRILVVAFEDLKRDTHGTLRAIAEHVGISADDEQLAFAIEDCSVASMRLKEREYWESQGEPNRSFVRSAKAGGWKDYFTPDMEEKFWSVAGEAMEQLGISRE